MKHIKAVGKSLTGIKNMITGPISLAEAAKAMATLRDMKKSQHLSNEVIENFCKKIAKGYNKDRFIPVGKSYKLSKTSDIKAQEILDAKIFETNTKERLIGVMKGAPCLSHLDDDVMVGLAKSISNLG